jgi:hypothetical protein
VRRRSCALVGLTIAACAEMHGLSAEVDADTSLEPVASAARDAGSVVDDSGAQLVDPPRSDEAPGAPFLPLDAGPCELHVIQPTSAEVAGQPVSCSYALSGPAYLPQGLLISVDGTRRARDDAKDGWRLSDDKRTVVLLGAACDEMRAGKAWEVTVLCMTLQLI